MSKRIWNKGALPSIGWWLANTCKDMDLWRWWTGSAWTMPATQYESPEEAAIAASFAYEKESNFYIQWTDYWPENARVPRIKP